MTHTIEISLRIPSLRVRREGKPEPETISNGDIRYFKQIEVESIPKPGAMLTMTVSDHGSFQCEVTRTDWDHGKNMFVATCRYAKRSIPEAEYRALTEAPDWQVRGLL